MDSKPFKIMVALVLRGDEKPVISQSVFFAEKLNADLTVIHVNQPVLSQPRGMARERINEETIRERISAYGFQKILKKINIIIENGDSVSEIINQHAHDMDLIILGHRKMNTFKSNIMDSIDEGISNLVTAPVLIVQKN